MNAISPTNATAPPAIPSSSAVGDTKCQHGTSEAAPSVSCPQDVATVGQIPHQR
jgi:hypothetical protein